MLKSTHILGISVLVLITTIIFSLMQLPFGFVFYLLIFSQVFSVITVLKILRGDFLIDEDFDGIYDDNTNVAK